MDEMRVTSPGTDNHDLKQSVSSFKIRIKSLERDVQLKKMESEKLENKLKEQGTSLAYLVTE